MTEPFESNRDVWASRAKMVFGLFAVVGIFFLLAEHRAHVLPFLPWLFLAACPLMHMFMHGGHGHGHGHGHDSQSKPEGSSRELPSLRIDPPAKGGGSGHEPKGGRS
jgi:hypothetical protein